MDCVRLLPYFGCFLVLMIAILQEPEQLRDFLHLILQKVSSSNDIELKLGVCVLSARDHIEQRKTLRSTWMSEISKEINIKSVFVIGKSCNVHPYNRIDSWDCKERWSSSYDISAEGLQIIKVKSSKDVYKIGFSRLSVKVLDTLNIKQIGIHSGLISKISSNYLVISLFDGFTEEEILSVRFSRQDLGVLKQGFYFQPIVAQTLPKDYEFEMAILTNTESESFLDQKFKVHETELDHRQVVLVEGMNSDRTYIQNNDMASLISFMFQIQNISSVQQRFSQQHQKDETWKLDQALLDAQISKEIDETEDVIVVNVTDVYRNLPQKLLECHKWFTDNYNVQFILKTDDDCYADLKLVSNILSNSQKTKWWWGNFRNDWLVDRHGKWKEKSFPASVYPKFACGSGNVISSDISKWLSRNILDLHSYQGEDTSMGIWLTSLGVNYYEDERWMCNNTCDTSITPLVIPELSNEQIHIYWKNKQNCGNACSC